MINAKLVGEKPHFLFEAKVGIGWLNVIIHRDKNQCKLRNQCQKYGYSRDQVFPYSQEVHYPRFSVILLALLSFSNFLANFLFQEAINFVTIACLAIAFIPLSSLQPFSFFCLEIHWLPTWVLASMRFYGRKFLAQKPIFTNGLTTQVYIVPGKLSRPQSGTEILLK